MSDTFVLDQKLNLIKTINRPNGLHIHVHSVPLSARLFAAHWEPFSRAWTFITGEGHMNTGPKVALYAFQRVNGGADGLHPGAAAALAEMRRLTNVIIESAEKGTEVLPFETAVSRGLLSDDEQANIENNLVFFILVSAFMELTDLVTMYSMMQSLSGVQTTSFNSTEFAASLRTLTAPASTGATAQIQTVPV